MAANSLDVSSDRDFLVEFVFCLSLIAAHLSTWAEEWILWFSTEFGYLALPDAYTTGSSIMPQKRNPDVLELIRGKSARVIGALHQLLDAAQRAAAGLQPRLAGRQDPAVRRVRHGDPPVSNWRRPSSAGRSCKRDRINARLEEGFLDATALMEYLIKRGVPMRTAHETVGKLVAHCEATGVTLADVPLDTFRKECPHVDATVFNVLGARNAALALVSYGSGGRKPVEEQLRAWQEKLA